MSLIKSTTETAFDQQYIHKGDLIRAQRSGWEAAKNGIVTAVTDDKLTILTLPNIGNVTNYFVICAAEVDAEEWYIRWTTDLETIYTDGAPANGNA